MSKNDVKQVLMLLAVLFLNGCAGGTSYVMPTSTEAEAAKPHKKTLAILAVDEQGSPIPNIQRTTASALEYQLSGRFNVVPRQAIAKFYSSGKVQALSRTEQAMEAGRQLKADLAIFVRVSAFPSMSSVPATSRTPGQVILPEPIIKATMELSVLDTQDGRAVISDNIEGYDGLDLSDTTALFQNGAAADPQSLLHLLSNVNEYQRSQPQITENAVGNAAEYAANEIYAQFPLDGVVLQLVSPTEVAVNLGSAYGVVPGNALILWQSDAALKDPRTGLVVNPLQAREQLEVTKVTGGLTCIAKGPRKTVSKARVGDKVQLL